jgi:murein L,D-transpeptidase YafK
VADAAQQPTPPRSTRRRRLDHVVIALLLIGIAAVLAAALLELDLGDSEGRALEAERSRRFARATIGLPLAGTPDLDDFETRLARAGFTVGQPIFIRIFKREFELELWMKRGATFERFATYPICRWSGRLGPKLKEGDRQTPEGFYTVDAAALNPRSRWHRSFNLGFPNVFDRAHQRTGSLLMVHGGCSSIGCFAMTDAVIDEIWRLVTAALNGGQKRFQVQSFPFRMTDANLSTAKDTHHAQAAFWSDLKTGHDLFTANTVPPRIFVCNNRYVARPGPPGSDGSHPITAQCPSDHRTPG